MAESQAIQTFDKKTHKNGVLQSRAAWWGIVVVGSLIALAYLIQVFSPLRVNPDAVNLLDLASTITDHKPFLLNGVRSPFPIGTPMIFSLMERIGAAHSAGFVCLNIFCLLVSAIASMSIFRSLGISRGISARALIIAFSSFVIVKHSGIPLSDIPFMAVSLSSVAAFEKADKSYYGKRAGWFFVGLVLTIAAISMRRIGIALVPAFFFIWRENLPRFALAMALIVGMIGVLLLRSYVLYLPDFRGPIAGRSPMQVAAWLIYIRCLDLGEVLLNVPYAKLGRLHAAVLIAGGVMIAILACGFWRARRGFHVAHVYLLGYLAIMFVWPYGDNRFWLPVLPLMAIMAVQAMGSLFAVPGGRWILWLYAGAYMLMFAVSAIYTTRITFSKQFADVYASGQSKGDYVQAWSGGPVTTQTGRIIRRYGMR